MSTDAHGRRDDPAVMDPPDAAALIVAVRDFLETEAMPALDGRLKFLVRVCVNALGTVAREIAAHGDLTADARARQEQLVRDIRAGGADARFSAVLGEVKAGVLTKLRVANPSYADEDATT